MSAAPQSPLQDVSDALVSAVAQTAPSMVAVHAGRSRATGFVWRSGLIVTAEEALADESEVRVTVPGGEVLAADLAGRDPTTDIALLRIPRPDLTPATLVPPATRIGEIVLVVGARDGAPTAALGIVARAAGPWRSLRGGEIDARVELDIRMQQGSEGGLAIDAAGRPFGMAVSGPRRSVLVIPFATIERVAGTLERSGRVSRGYIGLGLQHVEIQEGGGPGVMVMSVDPKGPGALAGIYQGDVVVTWDGQPVRGVSSLRRSLGPDSVGRTVRLGLRRAGRPVEVSLMIADRPAA